MTEGPIAYLTGEYPRATDTFIQREVAALREHGFDIRTFSIRRTGAEHIVGPEQKREQEQTFHVLPKTLRPSGFLRALGYAIRRPGAFWRGLGLAWRTAPRGLRGRTYNLIYLTEALTLAAEMERQGIRHLHNHIAKASCTVAMLASTVSGIPYSFTLHGPDIFFEPHRWRLDEKIARAAFVACISDFCRSQAMLFSVPDHWPKLYIIHCGIEPARYDGPAGGDGPILFVGRLAAVKGVPVLFEALEPLVASDPDLRLALVGDGPERRSIEALVAAYPNLNRVTTFHGYLAQDAVAEKIRGASMLVLPSFAEGVPVVLMEAMAAGKPVIATQVGGVTELVADGVSGRVVPPGNSAALRDAIEALATDADQRRRMGKAGRAFVRDEFDASEEAARLGILFVSAMSEAPHPDIRPGAQR